MTQIRYFYKKHVQIDQLTLSVLYHELFCIFKDFYAAGTQDKEVTKSLS